MSIWIVIRVYGRGIEFSGTRDEQLAKRTGSRMLVGDCLQ